MGTSGEPKKQKEKMQKYRHIVSTAYLTKLWSLKKRVLKDLNIKEARRKLHEHCQKIAETHIHANIWETDELVTPYL